MSSASGRFRTVRRPSQQGSLIVAALLLFSVMLALGLGLMSAQASRMRAAQAQVDAVTAKQLCLAAWQDARVKLGTDILFPPAGARESFSYSEDVYDGGGNLFGTYTVIIDLRYERFTRDPVPPATESERRRGEGFYIVTCIGKVGDRGFEPRAERTRVYELDMATFRVIRAEDRQSL